jgi:hypothetical protein
MSMRTRLWPGLSISATSPLVQALQFECFLRQIDIVGKWRKAKDDYVLRSGEVHHATKLWSGMTMGLILADNKILRVRTWKTSQYVVHNLDKSEVVARCLEVLGSVDPEVSVARRKDGSQRKVGHDAFAVIRETDKVVIRRVVLTTASTSSRSNRWTRAWSAGCAIRTKSAASRSVSTRSKM